MSQLKIKQIEGLQTKLDSLDSQLASGSLKSSYQQAAHGFAAGNVIALFNGSWVLADSKKATALREKLVVAGTKHYGYTDVEISQITDARAIKVLYDAQQVLLLGFYLHHKLRQCSYKLLFFEN
jgi:hypothetical protein